MRFFIEDGIKVTLPGVNINPPSLGNGIP